MKPMLASAIETEDQIDNKLNYPLIASPKLDGIRIIVRDEDGPVTRSLKQIPNRFTRNYLTKKEFVGVDGEIIVGPYNHPNVYNATTSGVMSHEGEPDFKLYVFDHVQETIPYSERLIRAHDFVACAADPRIVPLEYTYVHSPTELRGYEDRMILQGFEGIMLRNPKGLYKYGRSTFREQGLLKLKRFTDDEAEIIGFEEKLHNENEAKINELGFTERASKKEFLVPAGTLGALIVHHSFFGEFRIGSGFDDATRSHIWNNQELYKGSNVTFKYQKAGVLDKPRFPIYKGLRKDV